MSNVELNSEGVRALLKSSEIQSALLAQANIISSRCGAGYEAEGSAYTGKNRAIVRVSAVSPDAKKDNLKNNTLLKALGGRK